jgi:polyhydroxyalkanoate synthase subunit PhaC
MEAKQASPLSSGPDEQAEALEQLSHWSRISGKAMQLVSEFMVRQMSAPPKPATAPQNPDPLGVMKAWMDVGSEMLKDPTKLVTLQQEWWSGQMQLMQGLGSLMPQLATPSAGDKRFSAKEWTEQRYFDFVRQSYLLTVSYVQRMVRDTEGVDDHTRSKAEFFAKQMLDALSPSNFLATNPLALKATMDQRGENLLRGLENLLGDLEAGRISMTDYKAFNVGKNVAVTPGKVIFENRIFQLIQYTPTTQQVYETPILFFPPWINKFYILDLTAEKSMIKWLVDKGFTVFIASWINPGSDYAETLLDDYLRDGQLEALRVACAASGVKSVHAVGYCASGTLMAGTLAYLHANGKQDIVKSATFFTAQVDFSEAGDLSVFVDDDQIKLVDDLTKETGFLDSSYMSQTFNMLRSNDLIWSYVVNNYLLGKDPFPFDLLYWNSDSTRMPRALHLQYLKSFYQQNLMVQPGAMVLDNVPIDLRKVKTPTFVQAGREDHIAPAKSVYKMTHHFTGPMTFCLAGSGHIAGVVNPPAQKKYQYWTNPDLPTEYDAFVVGTTEHPGSWWPYWVEWLTVLSSSKVPARMAGAGGFDIIEDAPGRYVVAE